MSHSFLQSKYKPFEVKKSPNSTLYYKGHVQYSWNEILGKLEQGHTPTELRGNFAFVWVSNSETIAMTDHLGTIPLFYNKDFIGTIYDEILRATDSPTLSKKSQLKQEVLGGFDCGIETTYKEISRLVEGSFLENNLQEKYFKYSEISGSHNLDKNALKESIEKSILNNVSDENVLLLSSGTDSMTLLGLVCRLGLKDKFKFLHIHSDLQTMSEKGLVEDIAKEFDINVDYFKVHSANDLGFSKEELNRYKLPWPDKYFPLKSYSVKKVYGSSAKVFTGELGDQLFGGTKTPSLISYAMQSSKISMDHLARIFVHMSMEMSLPSVTSTPRAINFCKVSSENKFAYEECLQEVREALESVLSVDLLNSFLTLNLVIKGPFRIMPYSQDEIEYWHPFADWDVVKNAVGLESKFKINSQGKLKNIYQNLWPNLIADTIWRKPKVGTGIPTSRILQDPR